MIIKLENINLGLDLSFNLAFIHSKRIKCKPSKLSVY